MQDHEVFCIGKLPQTLMRGYRSIICLHGDLPYDFLRRSALPIIAADGAANELYAQRIDPTVVVGDLDSANEFILKHFRCEQIEDQNFCDFEKALDFVSNNPEFSPAIITGISGGFFDHILNNLRIFSQTDFLYFSSDMIGFVLENSIELELPMNAKISIFGAPSALVYSKGLRWELNYQLNFFENNSCGNRVVAPKISLDIGEGRALVLIYLNEIKDRGCENNSSTTKYKCPICKKIFEEAEFYPFCSKHCKNIDLNNWLSEVYYVAGKKDDSK